MRRFRTTIVLALVTSLFIYICSAQQAPTTAVPNLIRYSGTLKDAQGAVPSGTPLGVTFAIYKQQDGGAAVWQETQNVTPEASGQYSVVLGTTTATGLPGDLFSQQEQRWLGVQVQGEAEQARVLLVSVPYAFKAHEAETLGGLPASAFVKAPPTDASGSTRTNASSGVNVVGTAGNAGGAPNKKSTPGPVKAPCIGLTGGGTLPQIAIWDGPCDLVNSGIYQPGFPGGPVGILNPAPIAALDVNGAINTSTSGFNSANYQIIESPVLSIGWPSNRAVIANQNLYVGVLAGAQGFVQTGTGTGNFGINNTFVGYNAAFHNQGKNDGTKGSSNTAVGVGAGYRNTDGNNNTFLGVDADFGMFNTAVSNNTILGFKAGFNNATDNNTFVGALSGNQNTTGPHNTFVGYEAGQSNITGDENTFYGYQAGYSNTTDMESNFGRWNTFLGSQAGHSNTIGGANTFSGYQAGYSHLDGCCNAFYGDLAGANNAHGEYNTFIGHNAGGGSGNYDIYIGNDVNGGSEDGAIRIGGNFITSAYIQGIHGKLVDASTGVGVLVDQNGKLGTILSSRRFKEQIRDMGDSSGGLLKLRPVTFFYKPEYDKGTRTLQFGLIAEEVAEVYPEMVAYDKDGQPFTVKYQLLAPMLLNELQKQHTVVSAQQDVIKTQQEQIQTQGQQITDLQQRLSRLESLIAKK